MTTQTFSRRQLRGFSDFSYHFSESQQTFADFISQPFLSLSDLNDQVSRKSQSYSSAHRNMLVEVLAEQLGDELSPSQMQNLKLLNNDNTFTVTTGHQLTLFAGPLFLVYKVLHAVRLAEEFNRQSTQHTLVPIFWLASEDHDFQEIQTANVFGNDLRWESDQSGAVGRFLTQDYVPVLEQLKSLFASRGDSELLEILKNLPSDNYAIWFQRFTQRLFAHYGVLVIQPDDRRLKTLFAPIMEREILDSPSRSAVDGTNARLEAAGFKSQAQAREINLFYLEEGKRSRIERNEDGYRIGDKVFSEPELIEAVHHSPERFSPNVILRPVYQETILPNLCYIGGGGEMAYWIQLKEVFHAFQVPMPLIQQRISFVLSDSATRKKREKLELELPFFFGEINQMKQEYLLQHSEQELDTTAVDLRFEELREAMIEKAKSVDAAQVSAAEAECARMEKQLDNFRQKLKKQIKVQHEQELKHLEFIHSRFYPGGELQERSAHWLTFCPDGNFSRLFRQIYDNLNPFEPGVVYLEV